MKGTEKIIAHIQADANAQVDAILAQAEQQCAGIRGDFDKKAAEIYAERVRAGVKETQDRVDGTQRIARMEGRKNMLAAKQELVSRSFQKALEQIVSLPEDRYVDFLAKLAAQAAVTGDEEIILNPRDRERIGEKLVKAVNERLPKGAMKLSGDTRDIAGGLILRRGSVEANCSAELLVELSQSDLSAKVAEILFQ